MRYEILKTDGRAKRARMETVHGVIETPVFMNVGTAGVIKGAVSTKDLLAIGTQVELSNTYHLHVRPGDALIRELGGLHRFMNWDRPILTDSGGFQVFSLAGMRKIKEEGVTFHSHIDGRKIFMGPEESIRIQSNLGSTIAMAFDECPPALAERSYILPSVERTTRWLLRCKAEMARLNALPDTVNREQLLFGINQGGIIEDIRIDHAKRIREMELDGYAVGGKHYCADCQYAAAPSPYVCPFPFRCERCGIPLPVPGYCEECWRIKTHTDDFGYVLRTCPRCQRRFRDYDPPNTTPFCPSCLAIPPAAE